jgi:EAL domain-containing protein (putative c-di-GMP-specific phosphodiesterase class I)
MALAEGVETVAEANACREIGFDLAQGYLFGRPEIASKFKLDVTAPGSEIDEMLKQFEAQQAASH